MSCLYERNYHDYFQCVRECVNSKNSFEGASYFIRIGSKTEAIPKNLIFPTIYGYIIPGYTLPENSHLIVSLRKADTSIEYIKNIGERREDIYFINEYSRTKLPESILLKNSKNFEDIKKLIEARAYYLTTKRDIEKLKKSLDKRFVDNFYIPLSLSLIPLLNNQEYFPNIYYISKPYTIEIPYVYEIIYTTSGIIKKPIKIFNDDLNCLSIIEFEKYSTIELYSLNLDYKFELNRNNLNNFEIQINYDDFRYRILNSIEKILKSISILMFSPEDIGTYQIIRNNDNIKFIDFASGIRMATSQKGLEKIIVEALKDIIEGIVESPLIKHCTKNGNYVICNEKIEESELPKILVADIERSLKDDYNNNIYNLIKNIKIGNNKLIDIIRQHREDEFEKNKEIVSRAIELYLRSHTN
jgi:hypothetical protein